jgi:uncharacterized SAM-binding protein YcdF (DUF218 family)
MGDVFLILSKILDLFLEPLTWALVLLAAGLMARRRRGLADAFVGLALAVVVAFSSEPVARRLMHHAEASARSTFQANLTYDAVIVLGGAVEPAPSRAVGSTQMNAAGDRVIRAAELLRNGHARSVLVSGGLIRPQPGEPSEAEQIAARLRDWGIPPDRITLETRSRNTRENAVESARAVSARGWRRLLLVTSAVHMQRALGCFRAVGLSPDALPVDFRAGDGRGESWLPRAHALDMSTNAIRELAGRLVYWMVGYSKP